MADRALAQGVETEIAAVVSQWQSPPSDPAALAKLAVRSAKLRDARVLAAVQAAAQQASSATARLAALRAAFTFAVQRASAFPSIEDLTGDSLELVGGGSGIVETPGAQQVTLLSLSSLASATQSLAVNDPSPDVRAAAARVHFLARVAIAPKPQLAYVCGRKFRLRNSSDLPVLVEYSVSGSSETGEVNVAASPAGASYRDTFFSTDNYGSVTVLGLSGEVIGSVANTRTPCR